MIAATKSSTLTYSLTRKPAMVCGVGMVDAHAFDEQPTQGVAGDVDHEQRLRRLRSTMRGSSS
jgi:hypothetical protein